MSTSDSQRESITANVRYDSTSRKYFLPLSSPHLYQNNRNLVNAMLQMNESIGIGEDYIVATSIPGVKKGVGKNSNAKNTMGH